VEPFRVICETCRSRLKIRSADVIGEIHACPKCGSMVHILPPAGWQPGPATPQSATQVHAAATEPALTISTTASTIIPAAIANQLPPGVEPAVVETAPVVPAAVENAIPETATAASMTWIWWVAGSVAALLVAGLAIAAWPSHDNKVEQTPPAAANTVASAEPTAQTPNEATEQSKSEVARPNASKDSRESEKAPAQTAEAESTKELAAQPIAEAPKAPANSDPQQVAEKPNDESTKPAAAEPAKVAIASPPIAAPVETTTTEPAAKDSHAPVLKFDPLDFDPDHLNTGGKSAPAPQTVTKSVPDQPPPEAVATASPNADSALAANAVAVPPDDIVPSKQPAAKSITASRGPLIDAPQRDSAQALAAQVKSFQVTEMPFARLVDTLSNISGSGITLDPLALELVGVSPRKPISVDVQNATLESILRGTIKNERLDLANAGDRLRLVLPKADTPHAFDYDVKDLTTGSDATPVAELIQQFVAPQSWKSGGGKGTLQVSGTTLHIEQSDAVRRKIIVFCERLRLSRGLTPRSKYPPALLSVDSSYEKLAPKLNKKTTFTFLAWTRLADVTRNWEEMTRLTVLVDWTALAEAELSPTSPVACSVVDRSWQDALDGVLEPLGLAWWAVDGETIQITTPAALEKIQRVEFYSVTPKLRSQFAAGQSLVETLQKEISEHAGKENSKTVVHMKLDEPNGRLIVLGPAGAHRFLANRLAPSAQ
jgi:hypothetical protein